MLNYLKIIITSLFVCVPLFTFCQEDTSDFFSQGKAADFFLDPSKERDLLQSLFDNNPLQKKQQKPFTLAGEAGVLITTGNTETSMVKVAFDSNHETENWSNSYATQFLQRTTDVPDTGKIETTRFEISGQFDYKLGNDNNRLFAYVEYDDNQFNLLRDQATIVTGWSQVMWQNEDSEFRYSIGPGYSYLVQERTDTTLQEMIVRGTLNYNLSFGDDARFRQVFSAEVGQELTKAGSQSSITAKIFEKLAMKLSLDVVLNDNVSDEDKVVSTQTSISMVYQFF